MTRRLRRTYYERRQWRAERTDTLVTQLQNITHKQMKDSQRSLSNKQSRTSRRNNTSATAGATPMLSMASTAMQRHMTEAEMEAEDKSMPTVISADLGSRKITPLYPLVDRGIERQPIEKNQLDNDTTSATSPVAVAWAISRFSWKPRDQIPTSTFRYHGGRSITKEYSAAKKWRFAIQSVRKKVRVSRLMGADMKFEKPVAQELHPADSVLAAAAPSASFAERVQLELGALYSLEAFRPLKSSAAARFSASPSSAETSSSTTQQAMITSNSTSTAIVPVLRPSSARVTMAVSPAPPSETSSDSSPHERYVAHHFEMLHRLSLSFSRILRLFVFLIRNGRQVFTFDIKAPSSSFPERTIVAPVSILKKTPRTSVEFASNDTTTSMVTPTTSLSTVGGVRTKPRAGKFLLSLKLPTAEEMREEKEREYATPGSLSDRQIHATPTQLAQQARRRAVARERILRVWGPLQDEETDAVAANGGMTRAQRRKEQVGLKEKERKAKQEADKAAAAAASRSPLSPRREAERQRRMTEVKRKKTAEDARLSLLRPGAPLPSTDPTMATENDDAINDGSFFLTDMKAGQSSSKKSVTISGPSSTSTALVPVPMIAQGAVMGLVEAEAASQRASGATRGIFAPHINHEESGSMLSDMLSIQGSTARHVIGASRPRHFMHFHVQADDRAKQKAAVDAKEQRQTDKAHAAVQKQLQRLFADCWAGVRLVSGASEAAAQHHRHRLLAKHDDDTSHHHLHHQHHHHQAHTLTSSSEVDAAGAMGVRSNRASSVWSLGNNGRRHVDPSVLAKAHARPYALLHDAFAPTPSPSVNLRTTKPHSSSSSSNRQHTLPSFSPSGLNELATMIQPQSDARYGGEHGLLHTDARGTNLSVLPTGMSPPISPNPPPHGATGGSPPLSPPQQGGTTTTTTSNGNQFRIDHVNRYLSEYRSQARMTGAAASVSSPGVLSSPIINESPSLAPRSLQSNNVPPLPSSVPNSLQSLSEPVVPLSITLTASTLGESDSNQAELLSPGGSASPPPPLSPSSPLGTPRRLFSSFPKFGLLALRAMSGNRFDQSTVTSLGDAGEFAAGRYHVVCIRGCQPNFTRDALRSMLQSMTIIKVAAIFMARSDRSLFVQYSMTRTTNNQDDTTGGEGDQSARSVTGGASSSTTPSNIPEATPRKSREVLDEISNRLSAGGQIHALVNRSSRTEMKHAIFHGLVRLAITAKAFADPRPILVSHHARSPSRQNMNTLAATTSTSQPTSATHSRRSSALNLPADGVAALAAVLAMKDEQTEIPDLPPMTATLSHRTRSGAETDRPSTRSSSRNNNTQRSPRAMTQVTPRVWAADNTNTTALVLWSEQNGGNQSHRSNDHHGGGGWVSPFVRQSTDREQAKRRSKSPYSNILGDTRPVVGSSNAPPPFVVSHHPATAPRNNSEQPQSATSSTTTTTPVVAAAETPAQTTSNEDDESRPTTATPNVNNSEQSTPLPSAWQRLRGGIAPSSAPSSRATTSSSPRATSPKNKRQSHQRPATSAAVMHTTTIKTNSGTTVINTPISPPSPRSSTSSPGSSAPSSPLPQSSQQQSSSRPIVPPLLLSHLTPSADPPTATTTSSSAPSISGTSTAPTFLTALPAGQNVSSSGAIRSARSVTVADPSSNSVAIIPSNSSTSPSPPLTSGHHFDYYQPPPPSVEPLIIANELFELTYPGTEMASLPRRPLTTHGTSHGRSVSARQLHPRSKSRNGARSPNKAMTTTRSVTIAVPHSQPSNLLMLEGPTTMDEKEQQLQPYYKETMDLFSPRPWSATSTHVHPSINHDEEPLDYGPSSFRASTSFANARGIRHMPHGIEPQRSRKQERPSIPRNLPSSNLTPFLRGHIIPSPTPPSQSSSPIPPVASRSVSAMLSPRTHHHHRRSTASSMMSTSTIGFVKSKPLVGVTSTSAVIIPNPPSTKHQQHQQHQRRRARSATHTTRLPSTRLYEANDLTQFDRLIDVYRPSSLPFSITS
jgi:hypothetical protein